MHMNTIQHMYTSCNQFNRYVVCVYVINSLLIYSWCFQLVINWCLTSLETIAFHRFIFPFNKHFCGYIFDLLPFNSTNSFFEKVNFFFAESPPYGKIKKKQISCECIVCHVCCQCIFQCSIFIGLPSNIEHEN